jgi:chitinase
MRRRPEDSVKLSLSLGFSPVPGRETACYGYNAFCCSDPKPIKPRDPTGTDPFGSSQAKEFKLLIAKYMENPSCPATILVPPVHDSYKDVESKRDLISESQQHEILQGRATDCLLGNWERMLSYATLMFSMSQVGFDGIRSIWDNDLAGHFDNEIEVAAIKDYLYDYPWLDTRAHLEYVLLNPLSSGQGMRTARRAGSQLCHLPGSTGTTRRNLANGSSGAVDIKRKIWTMNSDRSGIPNLSTILAGILDGSLSLHYARWQYAWGQESNAPPGPFLELAYWIGPTPGVDTTTDRNYDQYRDTTRTYRQYGADRWVGK